MCLTCFFFLLTLSPPHSLLLSLSLSLTFLSASLSLSLRLCVSLLLRSSTLPCVCLSPSHYSLSFCLTHAFCLSLSDSLWCMHACTCMRAHSHIHTHTHMCDTYNITCTDSQVKKGAMPAQFVTTLLVTKYAGIAACFVTFVTKHAVVTKRAATAAVPHKATQICHNGWWSTKKKGKTLSQQVMFQHSDALFFLYGWTCPSCHTYAHTYKKHESREKLTFIFLFLLNWLSMLMTVSSANDCW